MPPLLIRQAIPADAAAIAAIYDYHARTGTATFDTAGPEAAHWANKIADVTARGWPFLVEEIEGEVGGYSYATQFRDRPAYARTSEDSIYLAPESIGQGIGRRLLDALLEASVTAGFEQMIAVVGGGEPASVGLHRACGFVERGRMESVGIKFGRRLDTVYLQRAL